MLVKDLKKDLLNKSDIGHRHNMSDIEGLELNASNVNMNDGSNVEDTLQSVKDRVEEAFQSGNNVKKQLVDTLIANGQNCTTSDSFDTLIQIVDNVTGSHSGCLDILFTTTRPSQVKEGQIVIISSTKPSKITIDTLTYTSVSIGTNEMYIGLTQNTDAASVKVTYTSEGLVTNHYIKAIHWNQAGSVEVPKEIYIGRSGSWVRILETPKGVFLQGKWLDTTNPISVARQYVENENGDNVTTTVAAGSISVSGNLMTINAGIKSNFSNNFYNYELTAFTNKAIDLTAVNYVVFKINGAGYSTSSSAASSKFGVSASRTISAQNSLAAHKGFQGAPKTEALRGTWKVDVRNLIGSYYVGMTYYGGFSIASKGVWFDIESITFE